MAVDSKVLFDCLICSIWPSVWGWRLYRSDKREDRCSASASTRRATHRLAVRKWGCHGEAIHPVVTMTVRNYRDIELTTEFFSKTVIKRDRRETSGAVLMCAPMRLQWVFNGDAWDSDASVIWESVERLLWVAGPSNVRRAEQNCGYGSQHPPYNLGVVRVRQQGSWFLWCVRGLNRNWRGIRPNELVDGSGIHLSFNTKFDKLKAKIWRVWRVKSHLLRIGQGGWWICNKYPELKECYFAVDYSISLNAQRFYSCKRGLFWKPTF
jgi:hypothetical protein